MYLSHNLLFSRNNKIQFYTKWNKPIQRFFLLNFNKMFNILVWYFIHLYKHIYLQMRFNNCIVIQHNSRRLYKQPHWCQLCRPAKELINIFGLTEMRISYLHTCVYCMYIYDIPMVVLVSFRAIFKIRTFWLILYNYLIVLNCWKEEDCYPCQPKWLIWQFCFIISQSNISCHQFVLNRI